MWVGHHVGWASDTQPAGYLGWEAQHPDYSGAMANGLKTKAGRKMSAARHHYQGKQCLDNHNVKPARVWAEIATAAAPDNQQVIGAHGRAGPARGPPQVSGSSTLTRWRILSCTGCPRNWPNGLAAITGQLWAFRRGTMRLGKELASLLLSPS